MVLHSTKECTLPITIGVPMASSAIHKMTFVPQKTCHYPGWAPLKINSGMHVFEHVHAFQVVKSALKPLPVNTRLILDAIGTQLNCSPIVNGLMYDWRSLFDAAWFDFCNLSIILYHHQKQHYVPYYLSNLFFYLSNMLLGS
jgi:hypothetical protein